MTIGERENVRRSGRNEIYVHGFRRGLEVAGLEQRRRPGPLAQEWSEMPPGRVLVAKKCPVKAPMFSAIDSLPVILISCRPRLAGL
jgi:hypothetical protein